MQVKSKCDTIVDDILSKIVNRIYKAGCRLPTEAELCQAYGVSRVTVRESLKKLEMMDVISIQQGRGTFVKEIGLGNFMQPMFNLIDFGDFDIKTIYDARLWIETGTCRLAALNRTEADIAELEEIYSRMCAHQRLLESGAITEHDLDEAGGADTEFHIAVARASKNEILKAAVINLENISRACARRTKKTGVILRDADNDHRAVLDAIRAGDPDAAERAIVAHTLKSEKLLL